MFHLARRDRNTNTSATRSKPQFQKVPGATKILPIESTTKTRPIIAKIRRMLMFGLFISHTQVTTAPLAGCTTLKSHQHLPFQCINSLDIGKVFRTVLAERAWWHVEHVRSKKDEALGGGWELRRQCTPALFSQIRIHSLPPSHEPNLTLWLGSVVCQKHERLRHDLSHLARSVLQSYYSF